MLALSEVVPGEFKIKAKKEINTEVVKKGLFSSETVQKETGNLIISLDEYKRMREVVAAASTIKQDYERLQATDVAKENKQLREENKELHEAVDRLYDDWKEVSAENRNLKKDVSYLKALISDLRLEIQNVYKTTKRFLKEFAGGDRAFKGLFKDFIDKVKQQKNMGEFEKVHKREENKSMER